LFWLATVILFVLWVLLSGRFDAFHLTLGVISSLFVAFTSRDLLFLQTEQKIPVRVRQAVLLPWYLGWLFYQIILANIYVMILTFHPNVEEALDPRIFRFKTVLKTDFAKFVFATSITLTPGTVTVRVTGDEFIVHAITGRMEAGLPGDMERRIARVFEGNNRLES